MATWPIPIPVMTPADAWDPTVPCASAPGMAIEESDASVFGDWYIWARAEVSFVPSRAKAAAWSAFKAAQAGRDSDQAAQFGKAVARSHQAREVEQRIEPHLSQYADWLAWAIDAVGASGKAAHVAAWYDRKRFTADFFCFQGPVVIAEDRSGRHEYTVRFGRLAVTLDPQAAGALMSVQDKICRVRYHIRRAAWKTYVTILRAEGHDGLILFRSGLLDDPAPPAVN